MSDPLSELPPLRDIIARHGLRADKSLGQNFILDANVTDKIARAAGDMAGTTVFEIGPGPGGLTRSLLKADAQNLVAVEFDPRAVAAVTELAHISGNRLRIVQADALSFDPSSVPAARRMIVANLPYNIATPLLLQWLRRIREDHDFVFSMTLMFQKEVAQRLTAAPGGKDYGRLSVMAQWLCEVKKLFDLPPSVFTPPPKVTSSVVQFHPKNLPPDSPTFTSMEKLTAAAFGQRRKMIRSSLRDYTESLERAGIPDTLRAEQLTVDDFVKIVR